VFQIKQMQTGGTLIDAVAGMLSKEGSLPSINWATWWHLPDKNANRLMKDPKAFYLDETPALVDGKVNPNATPKTYMDNAGVRHQVYMDEYLPMNALYRNLRSFKANDYVIGEIGKKSHDLYDKFFSWMTGGVIDTQNGKNYTETIQKVAAYTRELHAAERAGDEKAVAQYVARLRGDKGELALAYDAIKGKEVHITEGGVKRVMLGQEAVDHMMQSMDGLGKEYAKYVVMTDESIAKYFAFGTDGKLDHRATSQRFEGVLNARAVDEPAPYDVVNAFNYFRQVDMNAAEMMKSHVKYNPLDVYALKAYDGIESLQAAHPTITNAGKAKLYLRIYDHITGRKPMDGFDEVLLATGDAKDLYIDAKRSAEMDKASEKPTDNAAQMRDLGIYLHAGKGENPDNIPVTDIRARILNQRHYNQYEADLALSKGDGSTTLKEYYSQKLMDQYRFRETDLIDGWFPHRNFDRKVLENHMKKVVTEIRDKEVFSTDDRAHFDKVKNDMAHLLREDVLPGEGDDGKLYDAHLSNNGLVPMSQVVGAAPGALKSREANYDGYNTEPIEMRNAIQSVARSGYTKLTTTLNNDAIIKFERVERAAGAPEDYIRPWATYMRQFERQALNRPSVFTNEMLNDPLVKIKWTPAYLFSDHVMLTKPWSRLNRLYREVTKADVVTDIDKAMFFKDKGREMTKAEETQFRDERSAKMLDFSVDPKTGEYTPQALKNMENASRMFKRFSQFEAKVEMASLLFHTRFAVNNIYGGVANDYIYNGFAPLRQGRDIKYWNGINSNWKTMDDVHRFFESSGVIESIILRDAGYVGQTKNGTTMDKMIEKSAYFLKKTEPWLRREAAMHGYIAARESMDFNNLPYDHHSLLSKARQSVEASQFLYDNYNRPAFMATNLGKVFTRFKLWGLNSLRMQSDIVNAGAGVGFKEGTVEMARYQRMMWANMFMFGLATMFPHTIFQSQLPQPIDQMATLSGVFFGDDEENKKKRKNLMSKMEDPIRDMVELPTKLPGISFPFARVPLALYDAPAMFRAIWSHDVHDMASATTLSLLPFGRFTKDVITAYQTPSMAAELIGGIPLHRVDNFFTKAKKTRMLHNLIEQGKTDDTALQDDEVDQMMRMR
jgi:hypothetical protein